MNKRWMITIGLGTLALAGAALLFFRPDSAQTALEETRRALRQQGFKIDLTEFDLSASAEASARAAALTNADQPRTVFRGGEDPRRAVLRQARLDLLAPVSSDGALVVWKQAKLPPRGMPYPSVAS